MKRLRKNFVTDHPNAIHKNEATELLESIQVPLPRDAVEADRVLDGIRRLWRDFNVADEPRSLIEDPQALHDLSATLVYGVTNAVHQGP